MVIVTSWRGVHNCWDLCKCGAWESEPMNLSARISLHLSHHEWPLSLVHQSSWLSINQQWPSMTNISHRQPAVIYLGSQPPKRQAHHTNHPTRRVGPLARAGTQPENLQGAGHGLIRDRPWPAGWGCACNESSYFTYVEVLICIIMYVNKCINKYVSISI